MIIPRDILTPRHVANHYDELDYWYLQLWGEHVHHGLWICGNETTLEATRFLVHRLARRLGIERGWRVCDIGCGYGATSRLLASEFGAEVLGFTLSRAQYEYAQDRATDGGATIMLGDFLENSLPNGAFDAAISIESSEHMPDKQAFFNEARRILRPGGRLGVYAWLARETPSAWEIRHLLEPICWEGRLPGLGSESDYRALLEEAGFERIEFEDYSRAVRRTWPIIIGKIARRLTWDRRAWAFLLRGPDNRVFARSVVRIWLAYLAGSMRYGLFTATRPR